MAIDMSTVTDITLDNQEVTKIEDSLGNILWQKNITPPTEVTDKLPDATNQILQYDGGPISDYTTILNPSESNGTSESPAYVDGETYPRRIRIRGNSDAQYQTLVVIDVAINSTIYLVCSSYYSDTGDTVYIDGVSTSYVTPGWKPITKLALPMTSGVHTIGFGGGTYIWGIIGNLVAQNNNN